jgi:glycosyltransferase involved in cell wall biosynthesis
MNPFWTVVTSLNWMVAVGWSWRAIGAIRRLPGIADLREERYGLPLEQDGQPQVTVIVPARNEEAAIEATLRSLLQQSIPVHVIAVDDRSTDQTGAIIDRIAAEPWPDGQHLTALHVTELPAGWMGKTHALALAARQTTSKWLLFTDGDILFAPDALRRALNYAESVAAGHFVLLPTPILLSFGERMMMAFFQIFVALAGRLWLVSDPNSRQSIGIGSFNLVRRAVYDGIGGFESMRMDVLEDLRLGYQVKHQGYRQAVAFGRDLVRVHWAKGALGIVANLTKNAFAVFRFRVSYLIGGCLLLTALCVLPVLGWFGPETCRLASALFTLMVFLLYRFYRRYNRYSPALFASFPVAVALFLYSMVRSAWFTLRQDGVVWRGTFYPLRELRRHAGPVRK